MEINSKGAAIIAVPLVLWVVASVALFLRYVARRVRPTPFDLSDALAAVSWLLLLGLAVELIIWVTHGGGGRHMESVSPAELHNFFIIFFVSQITYSTLSPTLKASIVIFYRKLFPTLGMIRVTTVILCLLSGWGIAIVLASIFQCKPISKGWNPMTPGTCVNATGLLYAVQSINVAFDVTLFIMPLPLLWKIHRPFKEKLALIGLFCLSGISVIGGIVRVVTLSQINPMDLTDTVYGSAIWTSVEPAIGLVCASLPIVRGLFRKRRSDSTYMTHPKSRRSDDPFKSSHEDTSSTSRIIRTRDKLDHEMGPYNIIVSQEISVQSE